MVGVYVGLCRFYDGLFMLPFLRVSIRAVFFGWLLGECYCDDDDLKQDPLCDADYVHASNVWRLCVIADFYLTEDCFSANDFSLRESDRLSPAALLYSRKVYALEKSGSLALRVYSDFAHSELISPWYLLPVPLLFFQCLDQQLLNIANHTEESLSISQQFFLGPLPSPPAFGNTHFVSTGSPNGTRSNALGL
jgi:hypothetical protein